MMLQPIQRSGNLTVNNNATITKLPMIQQTNGATPTAIVTIGPNNQVQTDPSEISSNC